MARRFVRVDLSDGARDFRPLAIEPGVAVLDRPGATAKILFKWLGGMVAEPEWRGDRVDFFVRDDHGGRLEEVVCQPASSEDLQGLLKDDMALLAERLEKAKADSSTERAVLGAVRKHGLMLTAYSPVARGRAAEDETLQAIGRKHGKSATQVALRWLIEQKNVAAVPKAGTRAHAEANFAIFDFALDADDRAKIDKLGGNDRIVDIAGWAPDWDRA